MIGRTEEASVTTTFLNKEDVQVVIETNRLDRRVIVVDEELVLVVEGRHEAWDVVQREVNVLIHRRIDDQFHRITR
ncbi:hypothetical protein D3C73_1465230 [compost metagenome]